MEHWLLLSTGTEMIRIFIDSLQTIKEIYSEIDRDGQDTLKKYLIYKILLLAKISILLKDTTSHKKKLSYYKILDTLKISI